MARFQKRPEPVRVEDLGHLNPDPFRVAANVIAQRQDFQPLRPPTPYTGTDQELFVKWKRSRSWVASQNQGRLQAVLQAMVRLDAAAHVDDLSVRHNRDTDALMQQLVTLAAMHHVRDMPTSVAEARMVATRMYEIRQ